MARKDIIRISVKELSRIKTIHSVLEEEITQKKAHAMSNDVGGYFRFKR